MKATKIVLIGAGNVGNSFLYSAMNEFISSYMNIIFLKKYYRTVKFVKLEDVIAYTVRQLNID
ncbi:hypothetical protein [Mesomycoplasma hyorhinis]|uniref:hypothetical protein n=1 Tax=Mesomycoplasma hyorhinis TaxID=2100 RepID=UPI001C03BF15|nr:hypothetical protein [Mesomycoplasma hyorhinis]